jgi:hypothetical protein
LSRELGTSTSQAGQDLAIVVGRLANSMAQSYPRLKHRLGPATCNESSAMRDPAALLFNRSGE